MNREQPVYRIEGTDFIVDVNNLQLQEKENPQNVISILEMRDVGDGYVFGYSPEEKNIPSLIGNVKNSITVKIPELVELDPLGMAEKYGFSVNDIQSKTDFELMVDQQAYSRRISGQLPTVDIVGHTFYVDIRMDMLRPKDDFLSNGIRFSEIEDYYNEHEKSYIVPYNPKTHEFQEPDYGHITALPKDLIVIAFPHQRVLDPVGYNRKGGWDEKDGLKETNVRAGFQAEKSTWQKLGVDKLIKVNIEKQAKQTSDNHKKVSKQRRGRRL